jgi:peptide/nickel transport system permease protein
VTRITGRRAGAVLFGALLAAALGAPWIAPHDPARQFGALAHAPPMPPRVVHDGRLRTPFVYPLRLVDRLERRYEEDRTRAVPIRRAVGAAADPLDAAWLPLGADALGRDLLSRLLFGARASLGVALAATAAAILLGALVGGIAGFAGGWVDGLLMRLTDFVLVLPVIYVVLALRAALPLVLSPADVFGIMTAVFALAGWPYPARGVRALVAAERRKEYAEAARALGAGPWRILLLHLLPATRGYLAVQATLLLPAFIVAEATLSFVGFGFPAPFPSWGVMLQEAANISVIAGAPWLLLPGAAVVAAILSLQFLAEPVDRAAPHAALPPALAPRPLR